MRPRARSFVLDLLSTLRRGSMPVAALVAAGDALGLADNSVRVALARLLAANQVERDERGRYRLGAGAAPVEHRIAGWRRARTRRWNGAWLAVHPSGAPPRRAAREDRALRLLGFAWLTPGLALRPDNLRTDVAGVRSELQGLGLAPSRLVARLDDLDPDQTARARELWDVDALRTRYRDGRERLTRSRARLPRLGERAAMAETFQVGGAVLRELVLDPLLPEEFGISKARDALVATMIDYDRLGRACWARFLAEYDVPHLRTPMEARARREPERLATG